MPSEYRPEVDGLRAIAVIAVVLFHARIPGFTGGFVGVDVFFVISGYLITGILLRAVQAERFSLVNFYERRIRRIFPALFVVLAVSFACARWLLFPDEFSNFGKSLFATSLFYANYQFMYDTGYFAAPAESKPLLHMWSLAVEEQYYLLFPLYVYAAWRWCRPWFIQLTLALCLLSFGYCVWLTGHSPDQAFYSTPARAWELMVGALLAMWGHRAPLKGNLPPRAASLLALAGLALILASVTLYSEATRFPGVMALAPVLGAAAVIYATATPSNVAARLLSAGPIRFIGLISYSLYLWHWPVFVFYKTYAIKPVSGAETALMLVCSLLLSAASWRYVEQPFRQGRSLATRKRVIAVGLVTMSIGVGSGTALARSTGFPERFSPEVNRILAARNDDPVITDYRDVDVVCAQPQRRCTIGSRTPATPSFIVWRDSHAEALVPGIAAAAQERGVRGLLLARGGCPSLVGVRQTREGYQDCDKTANALMAYLADRPQIAQVILVSRWAVYAMGVRFKNEPGPTVFITDGDNRLASISSNRKVFENGLLHTFERLTAMGRHIALVTQVPEAEFRIPMAMGRALHLNHNIEFAPLYGDHQARQTIVEEALERLRERYSFMLVRPEGALCGIEHCRVASGKLPVYRDSNHLTASQARSMAMIFDPLFDGPWSTLTGNSPALPR